MSMWLSVVSESCINNLSDVEAYLVADLQESYAEKDYFPYEMYCSLLDGTERRYALDDRVPGRKRNRVEVKDGHARAYFNFTVANRVDSVCNCALIITIILLMTGSSFFISSSVSGIVLRPLEALMTGVKKAASNIFDTVVTMAGRLSTDDSESVSDIGEDKGVFGNETQLLEKVLKKLSALGEIIVMRTPLDDETLANMNDDDLAVLHNYALPHTNSFRPSGADAKASQRLQSQITDRQADVLAGAVEKFLSEASLSWAQLNSWDFNVLELSERQRQIVCLSLFLLERKETETLEMTTTFRKFIETAAKGYNSSRRVQYHNWCHAVDVVWMSFRMLRLCAVEHWLGPHECFAIVVSASCHDIGHPGVNNMFLVETAHELALRYNDQSPLEMMHCSKMFEIARQPSMNVFDKFDQADMREVRAACIESILHTDYIHHSRMVKDMQAMYEMNKALFDDSNDMHRNAQVEYPSKEVVDLFEKPEAKKQLRSSFVHFCDVANPTKPWKLCKVWALMIMEEFFHQGDREKELGLTVQPLNNRAKVNIPHSQVGFIEFFVAPMVTSVVKMMPIVPLAEQLLDNLEMWVHEWVEKTDPPPNEEEKAKVFERIGKLVIKHQAAPLL